MNLPHEEAIMIVSPAVLPMTPSKVWRRSNFQDNPLILGQVLISPTAHRSCSGIAASLRWDVLTCCEAPCSRTAGCLLICARTIRRNTDTPQLDKIISVRVSAQTVKKRLQEGGMRTWSYIGLSQPPLGHSTSLHPPSSHHMANALILSQEEDPPGDHASSHQ